MSVADRGTRTRASNRILVLGGDLARAIEADRAADEARLELEVVVDPLALGTALDRGPFDLLVLDAGVTGRRLSTLIGDARARYRLAGIIAVASSDDWVNLLSGGATPFLDRVVPRGTPAALMRAMLRDVLAERDGRAAEPLAFARAFLRAIPHRPTRGRPGRSSGGASDP